ncbi:transcriptional regulator [Wenjunlia tyrosinilytica]|uniref:Transcriptional regulator n=1 Tax=Wenjunlia tyrosinilytica TaxID=1544741 RepID=A0A917ZV82_9ACTN|nr:transcriptional regulator [Wenjunlia tyrosinilytica]
MSVEERREELLRAAVEQIRLRGLGALRIADVASALGVSNALVLYHFETKERLVAAAFDYAAQADLAHLEKLRTRKGSATARLWAAIKWYAPTGPAKGWVLWIEGWAASLREPTLREVAQDLDARWKAAITELVAEGTAAREFTCPDPEAAAWRLTALLDGLGVQMTSYRGALTRRSMEAWIEEALARELGTTPEALHAAR